jgi:hypothetical protein
MGGQEHFLVSIIESKGTTGEFSKGLKRLKEAVAKVVDLHFAGR